MFETTSSKIYSQENDETSLVLFQGSTDLKDLEIIQKLSQDGSSFIPLSMGTHLFLSEEMANKVVINYLFPESDFYELERHWFYSREATLANLISSAIQDELLKGCKSGSFGYQLIVQKSQFILKWVGKRTCGFFHDKGVEIMPPRPNEPKMDLRVNGFHAEVTFKLASTAKERNWFVLFHVTDQLFVDQFELQRRGLNATFIGQIDLEAPQYSPMAKSHFVILKLDGEIAIPFHFRYHEPDVEKFSQFMIDLPVLIESVDNENCVPIVLPERLMSHFGDQCLQIYGSKSVKVAIPIGDIELLAFIETWTYIVSILGVFLVLLTLFSTKKPKSKKE